MDTPQNIFNTADWIGISVRSPSCSGLVEFLSSVESKLSHPIAVHTARREHSKLAIAMSVHSGDEKAKTAGMVLAVTMDCVDLMEILLPLDIARETLDGGHGGDFEVISKYAAKKDRHAILEWMAKNLPSHNLWCNVVGEATLPSLKIMHRCGVNITSRACSMAALRNDQETVDWYLDLGLPTDEWPTAYAAREGHLHLLKYLVSRGLSVTPVALYLTSRKNTHSADVVDYLESIGTKV